MAGRQTGPAPAPREFQRETAMTENTAGSGTPDQADLDPDRISERLHRNAAQHGADLDDPLVLAGFLGGAPALQKKTSLLESEDDRRAHAEAMLSLVDALAVDRPGFTAGWNALLTVHTSLVQQSTTVGALSEKSRDVLFDVDARLVHDR